MFKQLRRLTVVLGVLLVALPLFLSSPASADVSPCPPGQPPGRPPGVPPGPPNFVQPSQGEGRPSQYPARSECALRTGQSSASHGESVELAGSGFRPGTSVELKMGSLSLGGATTDAAGNFTQSITVPEAAAVGPQRLTATGLEVNGDTRVLSASFEVVAARANAAAAPSGSGTLPRTGTETVVLGAAGVLLVGLGGGFVLAARKRKTLSA